MQQVVNACLSANGVWPIIALVALLVGFVLNRRVKGALSQNAKVGSNISVGRDSHAPITSHVTAHQSTTITPPASSNAPYGNGLSTVADVLQVVGFTILLLQLFKIIPST